MVIYRPIILCATFYKIHSQFVNLRPMMHKPGVWRHIRQSSLREMRTLKSRLTMCFLILPQTLALQYSNDKTQHEGTASHALMCLSAEGNWCDSHHWNSCSSVWGSAWGQSLHEQRQFLVASGFFQRVWLGIIFTFLHSLFPFSLPLFLSSSFKFSYPLREYWLLLHLLECHLSSSEISTKKSYGCYRYIGRKTRVKEKRGSSLGQSKCPGIGADVAIAPLTQQAASERGCP